MGSSNNVLSYVKSYTPEKNEVGGYNINQAVAHIVQHSGLKNKGSQLDKIINMYVGNSLHIDMNTGKTVKTATLIRKGVYKALGLGGVDHLKIRTQEKREALKIRRKKEGK